MEIKSAIEDTELKRHVGEFMLKKFSEQGNFDNVADYIVTLTLIQVELLNTLGAEAEDVKGFLENLLSHAVAHVCQEEDEEDS